MAVARWEGDAAGRLREAAMRLYAERGYEQTTVADIAAAAGLTARTFFRYFADKREVLFAGSEFLRDGMAAAIKDAPAGASPMEVIAAALDFAAEMLGRDREMSRLRQSLITANPELQERELIKMASIAALAAEGLRRRGVPEPDASLAAESGAVVLRVAFEQWLDDTTDTGLHSTMRATLGRLTTVTGLR